METHIERYFDAHFDRNKSPESAARAPRVRAGEQRWAEVTATKSLGGFFSWTQTGRNGGAREDRTPDLVNAIHALSQLSYGPISFSGWMLGSAHFTVNAQPKHHETSIT